MKCATSSARSSTRPSIVIIFASILTTALATSCGSGGAMSKTPPPPQFSGNTQVTVVLTGTANDQLTQFGLEIQTLTLAGQSGTAVSLLTTQQPAEFIHLNGGVEPLSTVSVPQGIYTQAAATIGGASFTCVTTTPAGAAGAGNLDTSTFAYGSTPNSNVTVNLASPITIIGSNMLVSLDLSVSQSASFPNTCYTSGAEQFAITPTFNLAPQNLSSQPTSAANEKATDIEGEITSINAAEGSFTLSVPEGSGGDSANYRTQLVASNVNSVFQGVSGFSDLAAGTFVDLDGEIQADGSLVATRIAVEDPNAVNVMSGPLLGVISLSGQNLLASFGRLQQGPLLPGGFGVGYGGYFDFSNAAFQISGQLSNLQNLPFAASFNGSNMLAGQNVYMSFTTLPNQCCAAGVVQTVTLMTQTINGTVVGSSISGTFVDYTVALASYDLFPALSALQSPWQAQPLVSPDTIEVYVDSNTQQLNTQTLGPGGTFRFYGLIFNDNGTLRMDCERINDGVAFTAPSNSDSQAVKATGDVRTMRRQVPGGLQQTFTSFTGHGQVQ